jgi:hypothetical protein
LTREEEHKENNNNNTNKNYFISSIDPFVSGTTFWQNVMTNWFNVYGEFYRNSAKIIEYWYDICWKPWLNLQQQRQQWRQDRDKVKVE